MRSIGIIAAGAGFTATVMAVGVAADEKPLGVQLVDQMNVLYGAHPGLRADHTTGAVFDGSLYRHRMPMRSVPPASSKARPRR